MTQNAPRRLHRLSTPRAAGLAGVLFALLFGAAMVLIRTSVPDGAPTRLRVASVLMPIAGIAFLWFIGVIRDGLGRYEDRFFATVFFGSGLLFLAMTFAASAVGAALVAGRSLSVDPAAHAEMFTFGQLLLTALSKSYALRMAAVFMISLATIWLKTGLMPKWLVFGSYGAAVVLLVGTDVSLWITLLFPAWVLVVSLLALSRAGVVDLPGFAEK